MMINVWADDNGSPGAQLITPFAIPNPATLIETMKWIYVDLSSYTELQDIEGDYFIGFECAEGETGVTRTLITDTALEGEENFGRAYSQYYSASGLVWEQSELYNFHIRAVTTNYGMVPGIIDADPNSIIEILILGAGEIVDLAVNNIGDFELDYTASIEYDGFLEDGVIIYSQNFDSGLNWISSGDLTWINDAGTDNLDGTPFAELNASTTGTGVTKYATLTSETIYAAHENVIVEFDQYRSESSGSYLLEVTGNGSSWHSIYSDSSSVGSWSNPDHQIINIPTEFCTPIMQLRFNVGLPKNSGNYALDNVTISSSVPYSWLTLDGSQTCFGNVIPAGSDNITVGLDAMELSSGEYSAKIILNSTFSNDTVDVAITVTEFEPWFWNLVTSISGTDLILDWNVMAEATGYNIYSSDDPYGIFTLTDSVVTNQYITPLDQAKMFYYITGTNQDKAITNVKVKKKK